MTFLALATAMVFFTVVATPAEGHSEDPLVRSSDEDKDTLVGQRYVRVDASPGRHLLQSSYLGSFKVMDGPQVGGTDWDGTYPPNYSCVEACAIVFPGTYWAYRGNFFGTLQMRTDALIVSASSP